MEWLRKVDGISKSQLLDTTTAPIRDFVLACRLAHDLAILGVDIKDALTMAERLMALGWQKT